MLAPSLVNKLFKILAWITLVSAIVVSLFIGFSLTVTEQGVYTEYDFEKPHPYRWIYALITFLSGAFSSLTMGGISEALTRLQNIEHNTEVTSDKIELTNRELRKLKESE